MHLGAMDMRTKQRVHIIAPQINSDLYRAIWRAIKKLGEFGMRELLWPAKLTYGCEGTLIFGAAKIHRNKLILPRFSLDE